MHNFVIKIVSFLLLYTYTYFNIAKKWALQAAYTLDRACTYNISMILNTIMIVLLNEHLNIVNIENSLSVD